MSALFPAGSVRIEVLGPGRWCPRGVWNVSSGLGPQKPTFLISSTMPPISVPIGFRMP